MHPGKKIKLYGERNTGTRYLARLIDHNVGGMLLRGVAPRWITWVQAVVPGTESARDAFFNRTFDRNLGWKHSQVQVERLLGLGGLINDVHFVALVKNPYSWVLSMARRPYHRRGAASPGMNGLQSMLTEKWPTVGRENGPASYRDVIDLWNCKVGSYLELASRLPTTLLSYEALVSDPAATLEKVRLAIKSSWSRGDFENLPESTKESGKDSGYYRDYYLNERWRSELPEEAIALVNARVRTDLMSRFGYRVLDT